MHTTTTHRALSTLALGLVSLAFVGRVQAFQPLARGELFVQGDLRTEYDSNIYMNSSEKNDTVFFLTPSLVYTRNAGLVRLNSQAGVEFQEFCKYTQHDSTNGKFNTSAVWAPEDGKSEGVFSLGYNRNSYANVYLNNLTTTDYYTFSGNVGHWVTEKLGLRVTTDLSQESSVKGGYSDVRREGLGVDGRVLFTPKIEAFGGYSFRHTGTYDNPAANSSELRSDDHRFSVGLDGELISKVKGKIRTGYVLRQLSGVSSRNQSSPFVETALDWQALEKTLLKLGLNKDFDTSAANQSVNRFELTLSATQEVTAKLSVILEASYLHAGYVGSNARTDDDYNARIRLNYSFTDFIAGYVYVGGTHAESNLALAQYNRHTLGFAVSAKY